MLPIFLLAAAGIGAPSEASERVVIDLTVPAPCPEAEQRIDADIIVCAQKRDDERHRLRAGDRGPEGEGLPDAAVQIAPNTVLSAETESADLGMARAQRLMMRLKLKF